MLGDNSLWKVNTQKNMRARAILLIKFANNFRDKRIPKQPLIL